jgi:outer membrane receptor protein involved in Fe transport
MQSTRRAKARGIAIACSAILSAHAGAENTAKDELAELIVTGSRIPTLAADETLPVTVLDATDLARGGLDSLGKVLQTQPISATSVQNTNVNNGGNGSSRVDLRSLEPKRTLVLLNGHRLPNGGLGGDDAVDLNSLPAAMIDRVEILAGGASAIYGADAVAGVVNLITKTAFRGIDLRAERSETSREDGGITDVSLAAGRDFFGGDWMVGGEYVDQRSVSQSARGFSAAPLTIIDTNGDLALNGSRTVPEGSFFLPDGNLLGLPSGRYIHVTGTTGRTAADYRPFNLDTDTFNYAPYTFLQTPSERGSVWLMGTQPFTPQVSLHVEALWNQRRSSQQLAPTPFDTQNDVSPVLSDGSTGIPADNYYIPTGLDLNIVRRRLVELPQRGDHQKIDVNRELVSLKVKAGDWTIEPAVSLSHSLSTETDLGAIPGQRFAQAVGPSGPNAQGQIVCGTPGSDGVVPDSAIIPNCVPINLFGGVGSITPEQIAGIQQTLIDHGRNSQRLASLTAQGPFGRAPGGPIQWAAGAEYRRDEGSYEFDPQRGGGAVGSGGQNPVPDVSVSTREVYVETQLPLAKDQFLTRTLDASAGLRYTDSSLGHDVTWQAGLRWQPLSQVSLRTNYARVFRTPSLDELYMYRGQSLDFASDPCGNQPSATQQAHCAANGVPGGAYVQDPSQSFAFLTGGNAQLRPETGYNLSSGLEASVAAVPDLRFTLDYYRIALNDAIDPVGAGTVLQQCADSGLPSVCNLITRAPDGSVQSVSTYPRNFGRIFTSGLDLAGRWSTLTPVGRFGLVVQATYLARFDSQVVTGGITDAKAGGYALPHWRGLWHVDYERGPWSASYAAQWIGGFHECGVIQDDAGDDLCRRISSVVYHDFEAAFSWHSALSVRLGVSNITDVQPPYLNFGNDANTDTSIYRLLGRTFYAALRWQLH